VKPDEIIENENGTAKAKCKIGDNKFKLKEDLPIPFSYSIKFEVT
jgi:hypothetical protein